MWIWLKTKWRLKLHFLWKLPWLPRPSSQLDCVAFNTTWFIMTLHRCVNSIIYDNTVGKIYNYKLFLIFKLLSSKGTTRLGWGNRTIQSCATSIASHAAPTSMYLGKVWGFYTTFIGFYTVWFICTWIKYTFLHFSHSPMQSIIIQRFDYHPTNPHFDAVKQQCILVTRSIQIQGLLGNI